MTAENVSVPTTLYFRISAIIVADDGEDKPYHSANDSPASYPKGSKYCNKFYAQRPERHPKRLSSEMQRRSNGELPVHLQTDREN